MHSFRLIHGGAFFINFVFENMLNMHHSLWEIYITNGDFVTYMWFVQITIAIAIMLQSVILSLNKGNLIILNRLIHGGASVIFFGCDFGDMVNRHVEYFSSTIAFIQVFLPSQHAFNSQLSKRVIATTHSGYTPHQSNLCHRWNYNI